VLLANNGFSLNVILRDPNSIKRKQIIHKNRTMGEHTDIQKQEMEKAAFILKSIAHPSRLAIIDILSKQPWQAVSEISDKLDMEQSLTSHHLNIMKVKGVLESKREGKSIRYKLKLTEVTQVLSCIEHCDLSRF
jgi:DNA-binding transcriptional ArsR family regulator